ncbi:hypothetical protein DEMA109039_17535 [Deinococcus marmoris]
MTRKASHKIWRREFPVDVALEVLQGHFQLDVAALAFLIQQTDQTPQVVVAARTLGLPLYSSLGAGVVDQLRAAHLMDSSTELTPRGQRYAFEVGELATLLSCCLDDFYLKSAQMDELRTLRKLLQPGVDIHEVLWRNRQTLSIVSGSAWADRLQPPELDLGWSAMLMVRFI